MNQKRFICRLPAVILIILAVSCTDMDTLMPAGRNYEVSARIEGFTLDEYALVKKDETIRPFLVYAPKNDPDIAAITVTINSSQGLPEGEKTIYILESVYNSWSIDESENIQIVEHLGGTLPELSLPDMEIGPHTAVFEVFGKNQALISKTEKSFYYMADFNYEISDISVHLPAFSVPSHLIPPGTNIMLEAKISWDGDLDPYIFWYNGRSRIGQGKVSQGANRILWEVPAKTGFQNIRAEVVPFRPINNDEAITAVKPRMHRGKTMELSLPISERGHLTEAVSELLDSMDGAVFKNFRFAGNLRDTCQEDPVNPEESEIIITGQPRWHPAAGMYGLGTGSEMYSLPFTITETPDARKKISIVLRFLAINDGRLFSILLEDETINISLDREENSFVLTIAGENNTEKENPEIKQNDDFYTLVLDLTEREGAFDLVLSDSEKTVLLEKQLDNQINSNRALLRLGDDDGVSPVMVLAHLAMVSYETNSGGTVSSPETAESM